MNINEQVESILGNKMSVRYSLTASKRIDTLSTVSIRALGKDSILSSMQVRREGKTDKLTTVDIKYGGEGSIGSKAEVIQAGKLDTGATVSVPQHNRMTVKYRVSEPAEIETFHQTLDDAFVRGNQEFRLYNFGKSNSLILSNKQDDIYETFIKFDLEAYQKKNIFLAAKLRFYYRNYNEELLEINSVIKNWFENDITYANKPSAELYKKVLPKVNKEEKYFEIDVSSIVGMWLKNPSRNFGFMLRSLEDTAIDLYSKESNKKPVLIIKQLDLGVSVSRASKTSTVRVTIPKISSISSTVETQVSGFQSILESSVFVRTSPDDEVDTLVKSTAYSSRIAALSTVKVQRYDNKSMGATVLVNNSRILQRKSTVYVSIPPKYDWGSTVVIGDSINDIHSTFAKTMESVNSTVFIKNAVDNSKLSNVNIRISSINDIHSTFAKTKTSINSTVIIRRSKKLDKKSTVIIPQIVETDYISTVWINSNINHIYSTVYIEINSSSDKSSTVDIVYGGFSDTSSTVYTKPYSSIESTVDIFHSSRKMTTVAISRQAIPSVLYIWEHMDNDKLTTVHIRALRHDHMLSTVLVRDKNGGYAFIM